MFDIQLPVLLNSNIVRFNYGYPDIMHIHNVNDIINVVYGNIIIDAPFGRIEITVGFFTCGFRVNWRKEILAYGLLIDGNIVTAPGWVLTLNEGFYIRTGIGGVHYAIGPVLGR
ncbi:MAG: hypothetical protein FWC95_04230 [Defluviitaleaceae bacterium]|nr:hypothetical protein [Defluviitaleaceae bacterium]